MQQMAKFKIISHFVFSNIVQQIDLWFMQKKWQSRWEREKKIYNTPSEFIIAHIFYIFRENEIFEFLSAFRLHSILQQQKSQKCVCVCVCDRRKRSQLRKVLHTRMHTRTKKAKKRKQNENLNAKCEKKMGVSKRVREKKNIGGMKSDSFFFWNEEKKTSLMVTSTVRETRK